MILIEHGDPRVKAVAQTMAAQQLAAAWDDIADAEQRRLMQAALNYLTLLAVAGAIPPTGPKQTNQGG